MGPSCSLPGPPTSSITPVPKIPLPIQSTWSHPLPSGPRKRPDMQSLGLGGPWRLHFGGSPQVLTYFQPSVVLQLSQKISATECSPVSRRRCSAGPQPTLTLSQETGRTQHPVGWLCQSSPRVAQEELPSGESLAHPTGSPCLQQSSPSGLAPGPSFSSAVSPVLPRLPTRELQTEVLNPFARGEAKQKVKGHLPMAHPLSPQRKIMHTHSHTHTRREVDSHGVKQVGSAMAPLEGLWRQDRQ